MNKTTTLNLKNGTITVDTETPHVVHIKNGSHLTLNQVVYHAVYREYNLNTLATTIEVCGWIKHSTIVSRMTFEKVLDLRSLFIKGEIFSVNSGSNITLEDEEEK